MTGRYLVLVGRRRDGWAERLVRLSARSSLEIRLCRYPVAILAGGPCHLLPLGEAGAVVGTLFHRHGPARPIEALAAAEARAIAEGGCAALLERYWGGYVAVLPGRPATRLLRDPSGALACYWLRDEDLTAFASGADLLAECGLLRPRIDWPALARHLLAAGLPSGETALAGVFELMPGFVVDAEAGRQAMAWSPWPHAVARSLLGREAMADRLERVVRQSVRGWAEPWRRILLGVSGGLDSSIVAALLAECRAETVCATLFTSDPAGDERDFARILCARLGLRLVERAYRLDRVDIGRAFAPQLPRPVGRIQAQAYDRALIEVAEETGAEAFLTGNGGDNVFFHSQSAAAVADRWLSGERGRAWLQTVLETCRQTGCGVGEAMRAAVRLARRGGLYAWLPDTRLLARDAVAELARLPLGHPWLEAPSGALPGKAAHVAGLLRAQHILEPGRSRFAPVVHPLLSQPVVEFCLSVPSWEWRTGGIDRSLARQAFRKSLPEAILRRRVKGTPDPFSAELLEARRPEIAERLLGGRLAAHGLIDKAAAAAALAGDASRSAADTLRILQLVAAEAWLDHWLALAGGGVQAARSASQ